MTTSSQSFTTREAASLDGMTPADVINAMDGDDPKYSPECFFKLAGQTMFLNAAIVTKTMIAAESAALIKMGIADVAQQNESRSFKWTIPTISTTLQALLTRHTRGELIGVCRGEKQDSDEEQQMLDDAMSYFDVDVPNMGIDTLANIQMELAQMIEGLSSS
jgi:hypothetical protein